MTLGDVQTMNPSKELEKFRNEWKKELVSQNDHVGGHQQHTKADTSNCDADKQRKRCHNTDTVENLPRQRPGDTLEPFLMADSLLKVCGAGFEPGSSRTVQSIYIPECKRLKLSSASSQPDHNSNKTTSLLDQFLADLEEINEIPFFDMTLPREVAVRIFSNLDPVDLCRCAQVSKSWKNLAEDELLWCQICQRLGYEDSVLTVDKQEWKSIVREHVIQERNIHHNWKNRLCRVDQLQHVRGGVLCAVARCRQLVSAGFSNGEVCFWDLESGDHCTFQPSSTALVLNEYLEAGTLPNSIQFLVMNKDITVAAYSQGNVDIWSNESGTSAIHTIQCGRPCSAAPCLLEHTPGVVVAYGQQVELQTQNDQEDYNCTHKVSIEQNVMLVKLVPTYPTHPCTVVAVATDDLIQTWKPSQSDEPISTLHNVYGMLINCMDVTADLLTCGVEGYDPGLINKEYKVLVYDIKAGRQQCSLTGHSCAITCLNVAQSPPGMLVSGSIDRRVRVHDLRLSDPVMSLRGHKGSVTCVQMDDWKIVSGGQEGLVCVWDQRMASNLWEIHSRHPVRFTDFTSDVLVTANIPMRKFPEVDDFDFMAHRRDRGCLQTYNFKNDQTTQDLPEICQSTYDVPEAYNYNIRLAMPYDSV